MVLGVDSEEIDWILGYIPPPKDFQAQLQKILNGEETFKALTAAYGENPKDVGTIFKLARKWEARSNDIKALEKYKEVVALDPQGKGGMYTQEYAKISVPYTEYAEFSIATMSMRGQKPDLGPIKNFITKYSSSKLTKEAYRRMASYYAYWAPKEDATNFFAEYTEKYPSDPLALDMWLSRIARDKGPLEKGVELAEKIEELMRNSPDSFQIFADIADFYLLNGNVAKAEARYGKEYTEAQVSIMAFNLINYANFWLRKNANQDHALKMAETAVKLDPENSYILQLGAEIYIKMGRDDKALSIFGPAYAKKREADGNALYSYAQYWVMQGKNLKDALAAAKKSVELRPDSYSMWSTLSDVYLKMNKYSEALKAAEKAGELAEGATKDALKKKIDRIKAAAQEKK
jgi:tetratricopeptide (TPR) repeat protein